MPSAPIQPILSDDVAAAVADFALEAPVNGIVDVAGPERLGLDELVRRFISAKKDTRQVVTDDTAPYYGVVIDDQDHSLVPRGHAVIAKSRFENWLDRSISQV
ncbi:hypothetical protein D3C85_1546900 [compost metagenome]